MKNEIIKTIEIEIAGVAVKVTPKEAKALFEALGELLNLPTERVRVIEKEVIRDNWDWMKCPPIIYKIVTSTVPRPYEITLSDKIQSLAKITI